MVKPQQSKWNFLIRLAGTIFSIVLLIYLFFSVGMDDLLASLKNLTIIRIVLVIVLIFISRLATFARWHVLLQIETINVDWKDSLRLTFAGLFAANFLPSTIGGDVVRLAGSIHLGIGGALAASSLMVDRLIGMTGMALVAPLGLVSVLGSMIKLTRNSILPLIFSGGIFADNKIILKFRLMTQKIISSFAFWFHHPRYLFLALVFTFIHMLCVFLILNVLIVGMQESMPFWQIAGLWSLTYFITLIPISMNGLGLQEVSFINLFTIFGGISDPTGLSIALIYRVLMLIGSVPGAFFVSGILSGETFSRISQENPLVLE
jgi:uncharacterized membrane protein YbhN (UPF0104 family)